MPAFSAGRLVAMVNPLFGLTVGSLKQKPTVGNSANRGYPALAEFTLSETPRSFAQNDKHDFYSLSS